MTHFYASILGLARMSGFPSVFSSYFLMVLIGNSLICQTGYGQCPTFSISAPVSSPTGTTATWTAPGPYLIRITAKGAKGGEADRGGVGGAGATITGEFSVTAGQVLELIAGAPGGNGFGGFSGGGGGGGSAVRFQNGALLVVAGGGGGFGSAKGGGGASGTTGTSAIGGGSGGGGSDFNGSGGAGDSGGGAGGGGGGYSGGSSSSSSGSGGSGGGSYNAGTNQSNAAGANAAGGEVVIECLGLATPNLSINDVSQSEGNAGNTIYTFTVSLDQPAHAGGVTFDIATANNTATTADNDYTAKSLTSQTIPEGSSTYTFTVSVNGDSKFESDESFFVNITNVIGANVTDAQGVGTITNDDAACSSSSTVTTGTTFCNEGGITINDNGVAMPYPSCIFVSGLTGTVQTVTITLKNLTHTAPDDIDLLLYSPTGQKFVFMSDVGGTNAVTGLDLILDSNAASALPDNTTLVSGTFRPADFEVSADAFPAPAPTGAHYSAGTTSLGQLFLNTNPNGTWYLYAVDDAATNTGSIGGWCLNFTMNCTLPNISAPTVTQPTCAVPTGTIVVNAAGSGTLEYSINNGTDWQTNATFSGLAPGNYTIKVRLQATPSCETTYGSNPVELTSPFTATTTTDTWTGCVSTDWATPGNWADGSVPTPTDDVVIPNTTNKPTIFGGTAAVGKSIEVQTGTTLTIAATATLTVNGSKSISGNTVAFFNGGTVTNSGQVAIGSSSMANVGKYGIRNEGTFTNSTGGNIQIDRWTDTGLYNEAGSFTNSGNIIIGASAATGKDGLFNRVIFSNTGMGLIQIDRSFSAGISNLFSATFTNSASITIGSLASVGTWGLLNQATFNNNTGGDIKIDNATAIGLYNESGTFTNVAKITIGATTGVGGEGINNRSTFNNNSGGSIQIDRTGGTQAFTTAGVVNNEATIEIGSNSAVTGLGLYIESGTGIFNNKAGSLLTINRSTVWGMENKGTLDNSGTIRVGNIASVGAICIVHRSGGTFNNKTGGAIYMDRTTAGGQALYSSGLVNNEALIKIGSNAAVSEEGIRVEGGSTFNNKTGSNIQIDQTGSYGIRLLNSGTVFNNEALIEIGSQSDVKGDGIRNGNGCTFNNKVGGDIYINRIGISGNTILCIINFGTFNNNAKITIGNMGLVFAQDGIYNAGSFTNNAAGIISIAKPWGNGVWNTSGTFQNAGKINISNVVQASGNFSTGILSTAPFSNTTNAEIHLDLVGSGIITTNTFTNSGLIRMGENGPLTGSGIANVQGVNAVFNNNAGGDISIKQTAVDGLQNEVNSIFNNNACAKLTIFDNLNNAGTFTNGGLFTVNTTQVHTNTALTNNGIIEYLQGNPIPNVTNNDVIASLVSGCAATVTNALQIGGINSFTVGTAWFKDQALTQPAGTYEQNTNTFTANGLSIGNTHQLYFSINDANNPCPRTVSIAVTLNPLPTASILNSSSPFCAPGNAAFTLSGTNGAILTYTLTGLAGNQTLLLDGANQTITVNNAANDITLTLLSVTKNDCPVMLAATATVTVYPLPTDFALSGGGISFCGTPLSINLAGSQSGVSYQLKRNNVNLGSPSQGTGNPLSFSGLTQAGTYTVVATTAVGNCSRTLSREITIQTRNAPNAYNLSGGGASCSGAPVSINLSNSQIGVLYQLKRANTPVGNPVPGTGNALSFPPQNTPGNYTAIALTQCADLAMNNTVSITSVITPGTFTVTGGGTSCGTALPVGLSGSQSVVFYQLYRNGSPVGTTVQGTGNAISLGNHLTQGQYTIVATRAGECPTTMSGSVSITLIDPPALFSVTGGGAACPGGAPISLSGSQNGIQYQLKRGNTVVSTLPGTDNPLSFDNQTVAGTYTVEAISQGNCTRSMSGNAIVTVAGTLPNVYSMTGGGAFCNNVPVALGLSDSQKNVSYQLQRNTPSGFVNVGTAVQGTGSALALGTHSTLGEYRVVVNSACVTEMAERKSITPCPSREASEPFTEGSLAGASVSPNPVSNTLHLKVSEAKNQKVNVNLLDASGRILLKRSFVPETHQHHEEFEVSQLSNGMYFLQINMPDKQMTIKVVKVE